MKPESLAALGAVPLDEETARKLGLDGLESEGLIAWRVLPPPGPLAERLPEIAGSLARDFTRFYTEPENQAYLAGCVIGAALSPRMRFLPGVLFTMVCGLAARQGWKLADGMRSDLRQIARAAGDEIARTAGDEPAG